MAIRVPADEYEPQAAQADEALVLEECTIVRWRGYTRSTFVACLADGTPVAESAAFKWRGEERPAADNPVAEAHAALVQTLDELGWTQTGAGGDSWFDLRYGRWVAAPGQPAEPQPDEGDEDELPPAAGVPLPAPLPVHIVREPELLPEPVIPGAPPPLRRPIPEPAREPEPVLEDEAVHEDESSLEAAPLEAAPLEAAPLEAAPAPPRRRGSRPIAIVSVLGIVAALALGGYLATTGHGKATRTVQLVSVAPKAPERSAQRPAGAPASTSKPKPDAPRPMHLVIANTGHASWLEIRRGSTQGPVVYSGIAPAGATLRYSGTRLWVRFAAAANFSISVDGRRIALTGTVERLFGR